jgi:heat shock protein HtpX
MAASERERMFAPTQPRSYGRPAYSEERRRRHKIRNGLHTALLLGGILGILAACAWALWGGEGVVWTIVAGALGLVMAPRIAPDWVMRMYGARPLRRHELPEAYEILEELCRRAGLERVPRLFYIRSAILNAFAVGERKDAGIAVTDGLLRTLTGREFRGVAAHEISHIRNGDLRIMNLADLLARLTSVMSWLGQILLLVNLPLILADGATIPWLLVILLIAAPTLVALLQLALSRAREYDADLDAAELTQDPQGLANALLKLERFQGRYWEEILLPGRRIPEPSLLRTHPPTEERVRRLIELYEERETPHESAPGVSLPPWAGPVPHGPHFRRFGAWY